jgi:hypothetical protein
MGFAGGLLVSAAITSCEGLIRDDKVVVMFSALAISLLLLVLAFTCEYGSDGCP